MKKTTKSAQKKKAKAQRTKAWALLSSKLRKETPFCQKCGRTEHLQVHHLLPRKLYPQLLLEESLLIVLCPRCHTFCRESAHKDGLAFAIWLEKNFPEKWAAAKKHLNDSFVSPDKSAGGFVTAFETMTNM